MSRQASFAAIVCALAPLSANAINNDRDFGVIQLAPYLLYECEKRVASSVPHLRREYESWLVTRSDHIKSKAKEIELESRSNTPPVDGAMFREVFGKADADALAEVCEMFRDTLDDRSNGDMSKRPDPTVTWKSFAELMQRGDVAAARKMLSGQAREKFDALNRGGSQLALSKWVSRIESVSPGERYSDFQELYVTTKGKQVFVVTLLWSGRTWKIHDM